MHTCGGLYQENGSDKYTHKGLYRHIPFFRLNSTFVIFQQIIEQTVAGIPGVVSYLDSLMATGRPTKIISVTLRRHRKLKIAGFGLKMEKCQSFRKKSDTLIA